MKKLILLAGIIAFLACSNFGCCSYGRESYEKQFSESDDDNSWGREIKKELNAASGGTLNIELNTGGAIDISGWEKESAYVEIKQKGDEVKFQIEERDGNINISSDYAHKRNRDSHSARITIKVPHKYNAKFSTLGGAVKFTDVEGSYEGTTMGGAILIKKFAGKLEVKTMGGAIKIFDSNADGSAVTMGGEVLLDNVAGNLKASTMGGRIKQTNPPPQNDSKGSGLDLNTMGGGLDIDDAPNGAKLKTMGGSINVNSVNSHLEAETMGGNIYVKKASGKISAKTMGGDIEVNMNNSPDAVSGDISMTSNKGDLTLTLPEGASVNINAEIGYTRHKEELYKIISDFKLEETSASKWDDSKGSDRKYIYGKGEFNGGKYNVTLKTINGNIYIKKKN